jgi:hypothetical protein
MRHGWWHGKTITCVWIVTKSCISFFLMITIYCSNMTVIVCFKNHNIFFHQAISIFKFNLNLLLFSHNWISPSEISYYEQIFMLTHLLSHNLMQRMWFCVLLHNQHIIVFDNCTCLVVSRLALSFDNSQDVLTLCF